MNFDMTPEEVLKLCISIESTLGRPKTREKNSPRYIDLDILYADNIKIKSKDLTIPHPRISCRRFVLEPLASIKPNFILPDKTKTAMLNILLAGILLFQLPNFLSGIIGQKQKLSGK